VTYFPLMDFFHATSIQILSKLSMIDYRLYLKLKAIRFIEESNSCKLFEN
jgi:hypothetical protein